MKKIYSILIFVLAAVLMWSCQKPEYVLPTAERQGITSLTAYFTSGPYTNEIAVKLDITDPEQDYFVLPIPYFYPEETWEDKAKPENKTTQYMTAMRIKAELANNCKIEPALTVLDLLQENEFVFTNAKGESRTITITGKRTKSSNARAMSFDIQDPYVEGFVNDETDEIYLFTTDDLSNCSAVAEPNPNSTILTDLSAKKNYNNPQQVQIEAFDGKTVKTYTILKKQPVAIPYGLRRGSIRPMFCIDPVSRLNTPKATVTVYPSLAFFDKTLVFCLGDGSAPLALNYMTGVKKGNLNIGSISAASVSNDCGGNLLIFEGGAPGQKCKIYTTKSAASAPVLFHEFNNDAAWAIGRHVRVNGNIDTEAMIIFTQEGGEYDAYSYTQLTVKNRTVTDIKSVNLYSSLGFIWGKAPTGAAKVCPLSNAEADGIMLAYYSANTINYVNGNGKLASSYKTMDDSISGNYNTNNLDIKMYNNAIFAAHLITSHFPQWSCAPTLSIYDVTSPTSIKDGKYLASSPIESFNKVEQGIAAGDVIIAQSADGFKLYVFYYDHNCQVLGGYSGDCIKLE